MRNIAKYIVNLVRKKEKAESNFSKIIDQLDDSGQLIDFPGVTERIKNLVPNNKAWLETGNAFEKLSPFSFWEAHAIKFNLDDHIEKDPFSFSAVLVRILIWRIIKKPLNLDLARNPITDIEITHMEKLVFGEGESVDRIEYEKKNIEWNAGLTFKSAILILLLPTMIRNFKFPSAVKLQKPS